MFESVITTVFEVESEAYQALSEVKQHALGEGLTVSQAMLVKKENGAIVPKDGFDTGIETQNDSRTGGLIGALVGIIGGPLGLLIGWSGGSIIGGVKDALDASKNVSVIDYVAQNIEEGRSAVIALVQESREGAYDQLFSRFRAGIYRLKAAEVAAEVKKARELQREMAKEAKRKLREEKAREGEKEFTELDDRIKKNFDDIKNKFEK